MDQREKAIIKRLKEKGEMVVSDIRKGELTINTELFEILLTKRDNNSLQVRENDLLNTLLSPLIGQWKEEFGQICKKYEAGATKISDEDRDILYKMVHAYLWNHTRGRGYIMLDKQRETKRHRAYLDKFNIKEQRYYGDEEGEFILAEVLPFLKNFINTDIYAITNDPSEPKKAFEKRDVEEPFAGDRDMGMYIKNKGLMIYPRMSYEKMGPYNILVHFYKEKQTNIYIGRFTATKLSIECQKTYPQMLESDEKKIRWIIHSYSQCDELIYDLQNTFLQYTEQDLHTQYPIIPTDKIPYIIEESQKLFNDVKLLGKEFRNIIDRYVQENKLGDNEDLWNTVKENLKMEKV